MLVIHEDPNLTHFSLVGGPQVGERKREEGGSRLDFSLPNLYDPPELPLLHSCSWQPADLPEDNSE